MAVVDGGIDRYRLLAVVQSAGGQAGAQSVVLGAGKVQKGIVGIEKSDGIRHRYLLLKGYADQKMNVNTHDISYHKSRLFSRGRSGISDKNFLALDKTLPP
jgi:hypothetical protein